MACLGVLRAGPALPGGARAKITLVPKVKHATAATPALFRPLAVQPAAWRITGEVLRRELGKHVLDPPWWQFGLSRAGGPDMLYGFLRLQCERRGQHQQPTLACRIDLAKAYDVFLEGRHDLF